MAELHFTWAKALGSVLRKRKQKGGKGSRKRRREGKGKEKDFWGGFQYIVQNNNILQHTAASHTASADRKETMHTVPRNSSSAPYHIPRTQKSKN